MGGKDERHILSIAACAFMLAGCADVYEKSAEVPACKRRADNAIAVPVSGPAMVKLEGSGKLNKDWPNSLVCIRREDNGSKPKSYDLRKIGIAL